MPSIFAWLRRLYSLDTLDTRFTSSATPAHAADTRPSSAKDARANAVAQGASPSLWRTPEFFVYYLFFITLVPLMFKTVIDASKGKRWRLPRPCLRMLTGVSPTSQKATQSIPRTLTFYHPVGSPVARW